jgi:hypothetical protein
MTALPASNLRVNLATWAIPTGAIPAVTNSLLAALPTERFDPAFQGQQLATVYFDTQQLSLRKARHRGKRYLTLRIRCYSPSGPRPAPPAYAVSAKTEAEKWRLELPDELADLVLSGSWPGWTNELLPPHLLARLQELTGDEPVLPVVCVEARRYAVEDDEDRYTLDVAVRTDTGKRLPFAVLEYKSCAQANQLRQLPGAPPGLRPIKLSKFLWATWP